MAKKSRVLQKILFSVWITIGLTCSMSMDKYYISAKTYENYPALVNDLLRFCRCLSSDRMLTLCVFLMAWLLITAVWKQAHGTKEKVLAVLFAVPFSVLQLLGFSYDECKSWDALFRNNFIRFRALVVCIGLCLVVYYLILASFTLLDSVSARQEKGGKATMKRFWLAVAIILLCWLPYYVLFWPGTANGDTSCQILQFFGYKTVYLQRTAVQGSNIFITNHHPVLTTFIFGAFVKLGLLLGSSSYGVALYTAVQMVVDAVLLEGSLFYLQRFGAGRRFLKYGTVFVALFPLFPLYAVCMVKDVLYSAVCLSTTLLLVEAVRTKGEAFRRKRFVALLLASSLLLILCRSQGIYIMAVIAVCYLILYRRRWLSVLVSLVLPILFVQVVWLQILLPMWNIAPAGKQEMLGFLFQQTARYVTEYPEDVTEEEEEAIRAVLDYDSLTEKYDPRLQDPVKLTYNQQATDEERSAYYHVWFQQFLRHPDSYIQATLHTCINSFYLSATSSMSYYYYMNRADEDSELYVENAISGGYVDTVISPIRVLPFQRLPVVNLLFSFGFYAWLILYFLLFLIRSGSYRYLPASLVYALSVCILVICPVSSFRYSIPFIHAMPFLVGLMPLLVRNGRGSGAADVQAPESVG